MHASSTHHCCQKSTVSAPCSAKHPPVCPPSGPSPDLPDAVSFAPPCPLSPPCDRRAALSAPGPPLLWSADVPEPAKTTRHLRFLFTYKRACSVPVPCTQRRRRQVVSLGPFYPPPPPHLGKIPQALLKAVLVCKRGRCIQYVPESHNATEQPALALSIQYPTVALICLDPAESPPHHTFLLLRSIRVPYLPAKNQRPLHPPAHLCSILAQHGGNGCRARRILHHTLIPPCPRSTVHIVVARLPAYRKQYALPLRTSLGFMLDISRSCWTLSRSLRKMPTVFSRDW